MVKASSGAFGFAADVGSLSPVQVQRLFALLNGIIVKTAQQSASAPTAEAARKAVDWLKLYY